MRSRRPILSIMLSALVFICLSTAGLSLAAKTAISPDMLAIQGRWIRTDSPYVIELLHSEDGSLQASYFNPKQIHVARTEVAEGDGSLQVMIELQDVNYSGSTYVLRYNRGQDILQGIYFQAATKKSYKVDFVRQVSQ